MRAITRDSAIKNGERQHGSQVEQAGQAFRRVVIVAMSAAVMFAIGQPAKCQAQAGRVSMEVGTEPDFNQLDIRTWYQLLTELKVSNLRIAGAAAGDKIEIETRGSDRAPVYHVKARLTARGQLIVPGGRFTIRDRQGIAKWLDSLSKHGPGGPPAEDTTSMTFGLDDEQLAAIQKDLGQAVDFSTVGMGRVEIVEKLSAILKNEVGLSASGRRALETAGEMSHELKDMACGTSLAYVLRAAGLAMAPKQAAGGFEYGIASAQSLKQQWPIGFETKKPLQDVFPNAHELVEFQVNPNTPLTDALPPIAQYLKTSYLFDENLLILSEIEPKSVMVEMAPTRTALPFAARKLIGQAMLKPELRLDDAGRGFYWITPVLPPR